jgi:hypothetical protein
MRLCSHKRALQHGHSSPLPALECRPAVCRRRAATTCLKALPSEERLVQNRSRLEALLAHEGIELASSKLGGATQEVSFCAPPIDWSRYHLQVRGEPSPVALLPWDDLRLAQWLLEPWPAVAVRGPDRHATRACGCGLAGPNHRVEWLRQVRACLCEHLISPAVSSSKSHDEVCLC